MKRVSLAALLLFVSITVVAGENFVSLNSSISSTYSMLSSFFTSILHLVADEKSIEKNQNNNFIIQRQVALTEQDNKIFAGDYYSSGKERKITMDNFPIELEKKIILSVLLRQCYDHDPKSFTSDNVSSDAFDTFLQSRMNALSVPEEVYVAKRVEAQVFVQDALKKAQEKALKMNQENIAEQKLCSQAIQKAKELMQNKDVQGNMNHSRYL